MRVLSRVGYSFQKASRTLWKWFLCSFGLIWGVVTQYYVDFVYPETSPTLLNFASGIYSFVSRVLMMF